MKKGGESMARLCDGDCFHCKFEDCVATPFYEIERNKEKKKEYDKKRYQENKEKILQQRAEYQKKNEEKRKKYDKKYYQKNKEKIKEKRRQRYQRQKEGSV